MNGKQGALKKIGIICIFIGILALILGILMLMFASYGTWIILCSVLLNIIGINFIIHKPIDKD